MIDIDIDYVALRRDPTPSAELAASYDPRVWVRAVDAVLARTSNRLHREILANYRRHGILEMLGRWSEILVPEMIVEKPIYTVCQDGRDFKLDGRDAVGRAYKQLAEESNTVFGPLYEHIVVADWGLMMETFLYRPNTGAFLNQIGYTLDPDRMYAMTNWIGMCWLYDEEAKLVGEMIIDDPDSVRITEIDRASVMQVTRAAELLEPLLDVSLPEPDVA